MLRGVKAHKCNRPNEQRKGKAEDQGKEYMRGNKEEEQRSMSRLKEPWLKKFMQMQAGSNRRKPEVAYHSVIIPSSGVGSSHL
jgi:hypothetical protein